MKNAPQLCASLSFVSSIVQSMNSPSSCLNEAHIFLLYPAKYEPVYAKWTTERCAVCRWVEDWDYNKIIICDRWVCPML